MEFTHLHVHTHFSLLDSTIKLEPLFTKAQSYKMDAIALTDHGNMFGAVEFFTTAKNFGIKPIIGSELYIAPTSRFDKNIIKNPDSELAPYMTMRSGLSHLTVLCMNETGYKNLCKLVSTGFLEGFYYKPRIDKEILKEYNEGLIALSGCLKGEIPHLSWTGYMDKAREISKWYKSVFEDRFYFELQQNNVPQQLVVNQRLLELSEELNIPLVATSDCHYLEQSDAYFHEVLMAIQLGLKLPIEKADVVKYDQFYFKSPETIKNDFSFCPKAIATTREITERCNFEFKFTDETGKRIYHLPKFETPNGKNQDDYLIELAEIGLKNRLLEIELKEGKLSEEKKAIYEERLKKELPVIIKMGFSGYFLIVSDFIAAARRLNVPVGPGRGSGAGSLVAYSLGITNLDPISNGLIFERFLNPERISLPDFDTDFCMDKRNLIIDYVSKKYGKLCVAQIITFGKLQARGVVRDVARVFGVLPSEIDPIAKLIPEQLNITLNDSINKEPKLKIIIEKNPIMMQIFKVGQALEGLYRHASIHAAGIVISSQPIIGLCPLYKGKNDEMVIQYDMNSADTIGLIKFDFLGLTTLTFLNKATELVRKRTLNANFSLDSINLKDTKIYELLSSGDTVGIFQLESSGMQDLMKKLKPTTFEDIVASNALYRPGPMDSGMLDDFINRKHGLTEVTYDFEELRPILEETYGVIVYQEQVQQIAMRIASYSAGRADILRRAMGKKKPKEMQKEKSNFLEGAKKNGFNIAKAEKLFDLMAKFAGYGFNKSHATAYSLISYQTAYLKVYYPLEFYAALFSTEIEKPDKIAKYVADAKKHGIKILPPDINESQREFTITPYNEIRFGLGAIKGVGQEAANSIVETRTTFGKFKDLHDFSSKTNSRIVNKRVLEAMIKAGAFDSFTPNRAALFNSVDDVLSFGASLQKKQDSNQFSFCDILNDVIPNTRTVDYRNVEPWERLKLLKFEKDVLNTYISGHPLENFDFELKKYTNATIKELYGYKSKEHAIIGAIVTSIKKIVNKRGEKMAFLTLEDKTGEIEAILFSDVFSESESLLEISEPLWFKGIVEINSGTPKMIFSKKDGASINELRHAYELAGKEIHVHINSSAHNFIFDNFPIVESKRNKVPLFFHLMNGKTITVLKSGNLMPLDRKLIDFLKNNFGDDCVKIQT